MRFLQFVALWNERQEQGTPPLHREIAEWLEARWLGGDRELLLLVFRDAGKSTLVALFCAWLLKQDANLRLLALAADHALAARLVRNVRGVVERHPALRGLKPARPQEWAADRFTVRRPRVLRDPSMLARGVAANVTGSRADVVICDDVEVPNTADTAGKREELRRRLAEIEFVLAPGGLQLYAGTPHAFASIYAREAREETGEARPFLEGFKRLELPIWDEAGLSRWPLRFTPERIENVRRRAGLAKFASQMLLQPMDQDEARLDPARLVRYSGEPVFARRPGGAALSLEGRQLASASCWWDPAFGGRDRNAVAAVFFDDDGRCFLHRVLYLAHDPARAGDEDELRGLCRQVAALARELRLPSVGVETNGVGRLLPAVLRRTLADERVGCVVLTDHSSKPKARRILEAFDAALAGRAIHAHDSVFATPFIAEMREWRPRADGFDDGLDAVAACLLNEPVRLPRFEVVAARPDWRPGAQGFRAELDFDPLT
jgi:hypothetical protein